MNGRTCPHEHTLRSQHAAGAQDAEKQSRHPLPSLHDILLVPKLGSPAGASQPARQPRIYSFSRAARIDGCEPGVTTIERVQGR